MTDGYISDRELKCSDCYIRNSCDLHPSTCNKRLSVFDEEGLKIHDAKVRADAIDYAIHQIDNSKVNCHEDYICGINYSIGVLEGISEQLKEQSE